MSVYFHNGQLLFRNGKLAKGPACCCDQCTGDCFCDMSSVPLDELGAWDFDQVFFRWRIRSGSFSPCDAPCGNCVQATVEAAGAGIGGSGGLLGWDEGEVSPFVPEGGCAWSSDAIPDPYWIDACQPDEGCTVSGKVILYTGCRTSDCTTPGRILMFAWAPFSQWDTESFDPVATISSPNVLTLTINGNPTCPAAASIEVWRV